MVEKYREDRDKQEHIIKSALKVFAQKGYGPVALDEIAREANLAKGTLYLYFQDKDDLVNKTILFVLDTIEKAVRRNIDNTMSPLEILRKIVFNQLNIFLKNPDFFGLFFILSDPNLVSNREKLFNVLLERQSDLLDFEMRVIERAQELGLVKKELDAGEIAHLFDGMLTSAVHRLKFMGSDKDFDIHKTVNTLMKVLLKGISTAGKGIRIQDHIEAGDGIRLAESKGPTEGNTAP